MTAASIATIHIAMYKHAIAINPQIASQIANTYQMRIISWLSRSSDALAVRY